MPRPDRTFRTEAIVLRRLDFGEADRLLTILTPDHGKLSAIAKSARKPIARQSGHVELFARTTLLIARGRNIDTISQAELTEPFLALREDLTRAAYANYVVELVDRFTEPEEGNPALYRLLSEVLAVLTLPEVDLRLATRTYELDLLRLVGFQPELFRCLVGDEPLQPDSEFYFSSSEGGIICAEHAEGYQHPYLTRISLSALKVMRYLQGHNYAEASTLKLNPDLHGELERVMQFYLTFLLERRLKSVDFIRHIRSAVG